MIKTYKIVYRLKGEGKRCYITESKALSKKELRNQFDHSVVIKGFYTMDQWNNVLRGKKMRDKVVYEYTVEVKDINGDVVNVFFDDDLTTLKLNIPNDVDYDIGLVRSVGNENEDLKYRSYAYFNNGKLPLFFDDGIKIPRKYIRG